MSGKAPAAPIYGIADDPASGGFALTRDGAVMRSPGGQVLAVPSQPLAEAMAQEWRAQKPNKPDPAAMPMTQLAVSALDGPAVARSEVEEALLAYARSDALLHRAPAHEPLAARQAEIWQPLLDWLAEKFGARLVAGEGIMPIAQSDEALKSVKAALGAFDPFALAGVSHLCRATGSLVLALAFATGRLDTQKTFEAAELETLAQIERWGEDNEARARLGCIKRDIEQGSRWFDLLNKGHGKRT